MCYTTWQGGDSMIDPKLSKYDKVEPSTRDIPAIIDYIIQNNITKLPSRLANNPAIFQELLMRGYGKFFNVNFSITLYEYYIDFSYIKEQMGIIIDQNNIQFKDFPKKFKNKAWFLKMLSQTNSASRMLTEIINYTKDDYKLYYYISTATLARLIATGDIKPEEIDNPFIAKDYDLFENVLREAIKPIPKIFNKDLYMRVDVEMYRRALRRGSVQLSDIPVEYYEADAYYLTKILEDDHIPYKEKEAFIKNAQNNPDKRALTCICDALCQEAMEIDDDLYQLIDKDDIVDYIIKNEVYADISEETFRLSGNITDDESIFNRLLEANYANVLTMWYADELIEVNRDKLYELFGSYPVEPTDDNPKIHEINWTILNEIFYDSKLLDDPNDPYVEKLAKYIANIRETYLPHEAIRSTCLLNALIALDIDFLFNINFDYSSFTELPIEKLQNYNKKHPESIKSLNPSMQLLILNVGQNIEVDTIKPLILEDCRKETAIEMKKYNGLAQRICTYVKTFGSYRTYHSLELEPKFCMMNETLGLHEDVIRTLLDNYEKDPGAYEEKINNLVNKFYTTRKEKLALLLTESRMNEIRSRYCKIDKQAQITSAKKLKRKIRYYEYLIGKIKDDNLNANDLEIIRLLGVVDRRLYDDNTLGLLVKIISGNVSLKEPASYHKKELLKDYRRLKNNYEPILNKIYLANPEYKDMIIGYLVGIVDHQKLRKVIGEEDLKKLHAIKELYQKCHPEIAFVDDMISFTGDYELTTEELTLNKAYDEALSSIKKIQKLVNTEMNLAYPLEKMNISDDEITKWQTEEIKPKYLISYHMAPSFRVRRILNIMNSYNNISDEQTKRMFKKLLIDSGYIYAFPFLEYCDVDQISGILRNPQYLPLLFTENEMTLENVDRISQKIDIYKYATFADQAILGPEINHKIINKETFIDRVSELDKEKRVASASKYISLAAKNVKSTIPYVSCEVNGIKTERYKNNDPSILVSGIDTDACFKIGGIDNDFLLYTMFNKNGIVIKVTDEDGKFLGRVAGFRNGNTLFFNQARTILDVHGNPTKESNELTGKIRASIEAWAKKVVEATKDTAEPIDYVVILKAYGYSDCEYLPVINEYYVSSYPMNHHAPDFKEFTNNSELKFRCVVGGFITDYTSSLKILLLASRTEKKPTDKTDLTEYDPQIVYDRPRSIPKLYKAAEIGDTVIDKINSINARDIYWGDQAKRQARRESFIPITKLDNIILAVIGEDFYIMIDKEGNLSELYLKYDKRAEREFNKYHKLVLDSYEKPKTKKR